MANETKGNLSTVRDPPTLAHQRGEGRIASVSTSSRQFEAGLAPTVRPAAACRPTRRRPNVPTRMVCASLRLPYCRAR